MAVQEHCARCNRPAPPPIPGPEGQVDQGWTTYEDERQLVVDVGYPEPSILPRDVASAIGEFDGLVRIEPDPQIQISAIREVAAHYAGIACPDCQAETGWDGFEWLMFMAGLSD